MAEDQQSYQLGGEVNSGDQSGKFETADLATGDLKVEDPFGPEKETKDETFIAGNLIKAAVYFVLAAGLVFGNFFLEGYFAMIQVVEPDQDFQINYLEGTEIPNNGILRFEDGENVDFDLISSSGSDYVFELKSGRVWGDFVISDAKVNILVDDLLFVVDHAVFDLKFVDGKVELTTFDGDVYMGFLAENVNVDQYFDQFSDIYMNVLIVPRDTDLKLTVSKISDKYRGLLPDKLMKVVDVYSAISASSREDAWVMQNQIMDSQFLEEVKQEVRTEFSKLADAGTSVVGEAIFWAEEQLVFLDNKKEDVVLKHQFSYLNEAIKFAGEGDKTKSQEALNEFDGYLAQSGLETDQGFSEQMASYVAKLSIFSKSDLEYMVYEHFLIKGRDLLSLNKYWHEIYSSMTLGGEFARESLSEYSQYFELVKDGLRTDDKFNEYLFFQNLLFDNLLLRSATFYRDSVFVIKKTFEDEIMAILEDGQYKQEIKQSFISRKIDFLRRAWVFLKSDEIELADTQAIYIRLLDEVASLMSDEGEVDTAVYDLFRQELESIENYWGYLRDSEYNNSPLYGVGHEERYNAYLRDREIIPNIDSIFGESLDVEQSAGDVKNEVKKLMIDAGLENIDLGKIDDIGQRFIDLSAKIEGYEFEAIYDRYNNSLNDIFAYEKSVSDRPVRFANLLALMEAQFADFDLDEEPALTVESHAERVARNFIKEKIEVYGFVLDIESVKTVRDEESVFRVSETYLEGYQNVIVTFDFVSSEEHLINLYLIVKGKPVLLEGPYTLDELSDLIIAEADFAHLEDEPEVVEEIEEEVEELEVELEEEETEVEEEAVLIER